MTATKHQESGCEKNTSREEIKKSLFPPSFLENAHGKKDSEDLTVWKIFLFTFYFHY